MSPAFERKRLRLNANTLGILSSEGRETALIVPLNSIIEIVDRPPDDRKMIQIVWDSKTLFMFAEDVAGRGEEE